MPIRWSRIIDLDVDDLSQLTGYAISEDLDSAQDEPRPPNSRRVKAWEPIFFSKQFVKDHGDISIPQFELSPTQLLNYAKKITKLRKEFE